MHLKIFHITLLRTHVNKVTGGSGGGAGEDKGDQGDKITAEVNGTFHT